MLKSMPPLLAAAAVQCANLSSHRLGSSRIFKHTSGSVVGGSQFFGRSVLALPDFTSKGGAPDGHAEYAVGAGKGSRLIVFSGRTGVPVYETTGFAAGDSFGGGMILTFDVDKDGVRDMMLTAATWDRSATEQDVGRLTIVSTKTGKLITFLEGEKGKDLFVPPPS